MVRKVSAPNLEPEESAFKLPAEKEHLFQVVDIWNAKDDNDVIVSKSEVVSGDDEGCTILQRINLNDSSKAFYYTRLFLKAIGQPYKGEFLINETDWLARQFYATVVHNGKYAAISEYNFEKLVNNSRTINDQKQTQVVVSKEIAWDE